MSKPALSLEHGQIDPGLSWPEPDIETVPLERFGKDHWTTFLYLESCAVDSRGMLDFDRLRVSSGRHPGLAIQGRRGASCGISAGGDYPTRLKGAGPDENDHYEVELLSGHDDIDCNNDLISAGLVEVTVPSIDAESDVYLDAYGRAVKSLDGEVVRPSFTTGLLEDDVIARSSFSLSERGHELASELRRFEAEGQASHHFVPGAGA